MRGRALIHNLSTVSFRTTITIRTSDNGGKVDADVTCMVLRCQLRRQPLVQTSATHRMNALMHVSLDGSYSAPSFLILMPAECDFVRPLPVAPKSRSLHGTVTRSHGR